MINSGQLLTSTKIFEGKRSDRKFENFVKYVSKLIGNKKVGFENEMCLAEMQNSHKNQALLYML